MSFKTLENDVMINSLMLEKIISSLVKEHSGKYVVFYNDTKYFSNSFEDGVQEGINKFGENVGFVVKKVTKEIPVLSSLVTL